ncbi:MAG: aspartate/glutamate racemase family protein [Atopobiaceae bacterium]|nr:aspartate/glutamate racemase family protein [Atopobiaceae bacterium]MBR3312932.1 aspartate/glutamate racemase family protein [Atopobiaceae bacterium]
MDKPVLGILGGVGPLATALLMRMVIEKTPARTDQENIPMIVFNDPQIPDRTAHILDRTKPDPLPEMAKVARWLQDAGADYIAIACNTAHFYYDGIAGVVDVPVLNIMDETAQAVCASAPEVTRVGLMATEGTVASGVFESCFAERGVQLVVPNARDQRLLNELIYGQVKANRPYHPVDLLNIARRLRGQRCDAVVVGCTELSVINHDLPSVERPAWLYDSLDILATRCVEIAKG